MNSKVAVSFCSAPLMSPPPFCNPSIYCRRVRPALPLPPNREIEQCFGGDCHRVDEYDIYIYWLSGIRHHRVVSRETNPQMGEGGGGTI